ncbi:hypothetical protein EJV47_14165 [Hymenobacter gummosus]|uniref:Uncharacterized protein n=1 Tax=Hymenobacter gummosus TaxID=1776032 RepID=A0A431U239_9BACT|nr:hypothetical protein [Hymenobacter gummosus]RTQ49282.1 hypothetical protein EJV47_14165 [Hymenobacter gummosus]
MKHLLLPVLLLPVCAFAQTNRTPTMQSHMQSVRQFNQMTNQRTMEFQQRQMQKGMLNSRSAYSSGMMTRKEQQEVQAKQLAREKEAETKLANLTQELQRKREQSPAANPQQAAAQQKKDEKQLTLLTVKNYKEVFLPGQLNSALQSRQLPFESQRQLAGLNKTLTDNKWWKQHGSQAGASIKAYSDTLTSLTTELLGFALASPPAMPATPSAGAIKAQLAASTFDQAAATQLMRDAALSEKLLAGTELMKAVQEFTALNTASPELQGNPRKLQSEVEAKLRQVNKAMYRYDARFGTLTLVSDTYRDLLKYTSAYVAKNGK